MLPRRVTICNDHYQELVKYKSREEYMDMRTSNVPDVEAHNFCLSVAREEMVHESIVF